MVALIFVCILMLIVVIYMALSPTSDFILRIAAVVSLAVMSVITAARLVAIFTTQGKSGNSLPIEILLSDNPPEPVRTSYAPLIILLVLILGVFLTVSFFSLRDKLQEFVPISKKIKTVEFASDDDELFL